MQVCNAETQQSHVSHNHRSFPAKPPTAPLSIADIFETRPEPEAVLMEFTLHAKADGAASERLAVMINQLLATNASTHQAYINLIEGRSDIGLLARTPSSDELELARTKSVGLEATPCALDAFVFLVNRANPVRNLTSQQIRDIYSGIRRRSHRGSILTCRKFSLSPEKG